MGETTSVTNLVDFYQQQLLESADLYKLTAPFWESLPNISEEINVSQRGVRYYYMSEEPGGHGNPTLQSPDNNRAKALQSDSMFAAPSMYTIPLQIDLHLLNDAGGNSRPKKSAALIGIERILKATTMVAAKQQEFDACGDGRGIRAFAASTLTVPGAGLTLVCETTPAADPGHTKGAVRLKKGQTYQSFDPVTSLAEGTFTVTSSNNKTQATVTLTSGVITSGNPICNVGSYNRAPIGYTRLLDNTSRLLQGRDTSVDTIFNVPTIDLGNTRFTVTDRETLKTMLIVLNAESGARNNLYWVTTPGLMSDLRKQQLGFRMAMVDSPATDITKIYKDVDGSTIAEVVDAEEDRHIGFKTNILQKLVEIPFGEINPDQLPWRNLMGANNTGSLLYSKFWGCSWTLAIKDVLAGVCLKGASVNGITTQVAVGAGN